MNMYFDYHLFRSCFNSLILQFIDSLVFESYTQLHFRLFWHLPRKLGVVYDKYPDFPFSKKSLLSPSDLSTIRIGLLGSLSIARDYELLFVLSKLLSLIYPNFALLFLVVQPT